jgi:hypothetical protein
MALKSSQDAAAGLVFCAIGLAGLWFGRNLTVGSASFMQAGYMPRVMCFLLIGFGVILLAQSAIQSGSSLSAWAWRPLMALTAAVLIFGILVVPAGLVITTAATTLIACCAGERLQIIEMTALTAGLAAFAVGLFHYGLKLPIAVWPF